jgi:hypothetical protein
MNTKGWNPITWAIYTQRMEYLRIFFENMQPNLALAIDINSEKSYYPLERTKDFKNLTTDE